MLKSTSMEAHTLLHSCPTRFKFSSFLPVRATDAPSLENNFAVAAPIPELAPIRHINKYKYMYSVLPSQKLFRWMASFADYVKKWLDVCFMFKVYRVQLSQLALKLNAALMYKAYSYRLFLVIIGQTLWLWNFIIFQSQINILRITNTLFNHIKPTISYRINFNVDTTPI